MPHSRPGTAVTAGRGCHGQMPPGHEAARGAARADGRDAQNWKIWRKVNSISASLDNRKIFGIDLKLFEPKTRCPFLAARDREER